MIRKAGEAETVYKFHSKAKLPAGESVTIWSCDAEATHEPPKTLVMKNQKWAVADKMTTSLVSTSEVSCLGLVTHKHRFSHFFALSIPTVGTLYINFHSIRQLSLKSYN